MFPKATIDHDSLEISLCKTLFYDFLIASLLKLKEESQTSTKNTFITFNYDNLLEKTLEDRLNLKRDKDYTTDSDIMNKDSNIIPIIKLHGSIDWIKDGNKIKIKQKSDPNDKERIIIPPTFKKVGQSQKLWENAINYLKTATRIIIIGYSYPVSDAEFKYLLAVGLKDNISLQKVFFVNPNKKDFERVDSLFTTKNIEHIKLAISKNSFKDKKNTN